MSKLSSWMNRIFVFVIFLLSCTRVAVTRILPSLHPNPKPPSVKVFALTEAAWLELRAGGSGAQDKGGSKTGDDKKEAPKNADCDKGGSKSGDDKKGASPSGDEKKGAAPSGDDKKDAPKSGDCDNASPGGGDGDTGGSGG